MPKLTAITKDTHAHKSWSRFTSYQFAAQDNLVPLVSAELAKSIQNSPIVFTKHGNNFTLVALLSLTPGQNMFVAPNGQWLGGYVPSTFRGYPFRLAKAEGRDDLVLCVDEDSGLIHDDPYVGEPFFDEGGEISKPVKDVLNFLQQIEQNKSVTQVAVSSLANAGLITEWNLKVKDGDQEKPVTGLYMIDEAKLNSLDDADFLKLRKSGSLPIAYGQLFSMVNIQIFERLAKLQGQQEAQEVDVDKLFNDDDLIRFE